MIQYEHMEDAFSFYGLITTLLGLVWAIIFSLNPKLREEQLILGILSVFILPLAFIVRLFDSTTLSLDFSHLSAIDFGFAFFLSGIAGTIFHSTFGRHYHHLPTFVNRPLQNINKKITQIWGAKLFFLLLLFCWTIVLLTVGLEISTPYAVIISCVVFMIYFFSYRKDLLIDSIWSGFLTTFIVLMSGIIASATIGSELSLSMTRSQDSAFGVPFDILLWAVACGIVMGPIYEFIRKIKIN